MAVLCCRDESLGQKTRNKAEEPCTSIDRGDKKSIFQDKTFRELKHG